MAALRAAAMLIQEQAVEIWVLKKQGRSIREIAREMGMARNTVRRYLREQRKVRYGPRKPRPCKLDAYKALLRERVAQARPDWIPATVLLREIQAVGYAGGISQLKAYLAPLKAVAPDPVVRFETEPGQQMQADFTLMRSPRSSQRIIESCGTGIIIVIIMKLWNYLSHVRVLRHSCCCGNLYASCDANSADGRSRDSELDSGRCRCSR
jgi:hypothetical protein